jgi:hypothetical protein
MTLREWCQQANVKPTTPTTETGAVSFIAGFMHNEPERRKLWNEMYHLEDYFVSSVCGVVVWMRPRPSSVSE